jgi:hypothetical protein
MIRFHCPDCHAPIGFAGNLAGRVRDCPECQRPVRIPKRSEIVEPPAAPIADDPMQSPNLGANADAEGIRPRPVQREETADCVPAQRAEAPTRRKKSRKVREKVLDEPHHYGPAIVYGSVAAGIGTLFLIPAMIHPVAAFVVVVAGGVAAIMGRIWFASISPYKDHRGFRLLFGFDESVVTSAFGRTKWPWLLQLVGTSALIVGLCALDLEEDHDKAVPVDVQESKKSVRS